VVDIDTGRVDSGIGCTTATSDIATLDFSGED